MLVNFYVSSARIQVLAVVEELNLSVLVTVNYLGGGFLNIMMLTWYPNLLKGNMKTFMS
jgi:hypothetical protein